MTVSTKGLSQDVIDSTQYLTDAINSTDLNHLFNVEITNDNPEVAFGDSGTTGYVPLKTPDGSAMLHRAINIRLDFADDRAVQGSQDLKDSFLNMVFAHEVSHFYPRYEQDPTQSGLRGSVDNRVNEIRFARGLPMRYEYTARPVGPGGSAVYLKFGTADFDKAGMPLRGADGIGVQHESGRIIFWVMRNVKSR